MEDGTVYVNEDVGPVNLCASIMEGALEKDVEVMVIYESRGADSK